MRIVLTHGRAQAYQIAGSLERLWEDALRDGLRAVRYPDPDEPAVDFAFYGDIWRPDRRALADAADGERGGEADDGDRLVETEPSLQTGPTGLQVEIAGELMPPDPDRERLDWNRLAGLIRDLDAALGVGKPLLAWFLKDLDEYFRDATIRDRVLTTMRDALRRSPEPTLLLGHSMGSIVGYDLLATDGAEALGVEGLVTFGSPLGMPSVHARVAALHPGTPYPDGLESWINVYNEQDFATVVRSLAPLFQAAGGPRIADVPALGQAPTLFDPGRGHDPITYLSSVGLGEAVASGLRREEEERTGGGRGAGGDPDRGPARRARAKPPKKNGGHRSKKPPRPVMSNGKRPEARPRSIGEAAERGPGWTRAKPPDTGGPGAGGGGGGLEAMPPPTIDDGERGGSATARRSRARRAPTANGGGPSGNGSGPTAAPAAPTPAGAAPPTATAAGMRTVERKASAKFPPLVKPGSRHELRVAISGSAVHVIESDTISIEAPVDQRFVKLRVAVDAADFKVASTSNPNRTWDELDVDLDDAQAAPEVTFELTATRTKKRRDSVIYVTIYRGNLPVGQLSLFTAIDPAGEIRSTALDIGTTTATDPDYVLVVTDRSAGVKGAGPFDISVSKEGEFLNQPLGAFPVTIDAWDYARQRLEGFRLVREETTPEDRIRAAEDLGLEVWWDLPEDFRRFYWEELHGKDVSIAIYSQEPYIPWELIRPQREKGGGEQADFLGVSFRMARWRQALRFPDPLDVTGFAVIAPVYGPGSGSRPLPNAQTEADELTASFGAERLGGDRATVRKFLESGEGVQLVHFAGHGEFDPTAAKDDTIIKLADKPLLPQDIHRAKIGRTSRPFVVLNACEVGEEGWTLTRIGGWAQAFTDVGFSGFVGPYWAVNDRIARKVANRFYGALADGQTVGEALRGVRRAFYDDPDDRGHPSWLAYTLHCQPNVHVRVSRTAGTRPEPVAAGGGGR